MTWTAAGNWLFADVGNLPVDNVTTGNLLLVEVFNYTNSTVWCTGLSGGGATWALLGVKFSGTTNAYSAAVFAGTVTATGAGTAVPAWSGTAPSGFEITGHEFHSSAGAWALDVQGNLDSAGTASGPSLTPATSGELYFSFNNTLTSLSAGSTPGYVYNVNSDGDGNTYNLSCAFNVATAPVWGGATARFGIAVLMKEVASGVPAVLASGAGHALNATTIPANTVSGPNYPAMAADLGGGAGAWSNPYLAEGPP